MYADLLSIFGGRLLHTQPEGAPCCCDRDTLKVSNMDEFTDLHTAEILWARVCTNDCVII